MADFQSGIDTVFLDRAYFGLPGATFNDLETFRRFDADGNLVLDFDLLDITFEGITTLNDLRGGVVIGQGDAVIG